MVLFVMVELVSGFDDDVDDAAQRAGDRFEITERRGKGEKDRCGS